MQPRLCPELHEIGVWVQMWKFGSSLAGFSRRVLEQSMGRAEQTRYKKRSGGAEFEFGCELGALV